MKLLFGRVFQNHGQNFFFREFFDHIFLIDGSMIKFLIHLKKFHQDLKMSNFTIHTKIHKGLSILLMASQHVSYLKSKRHSNHI